MGEDLSAEPEPLSAEEGGRPQAPRPGTGPEGTDDVGPSAPVWKDRAVGVAPASRRLSLSLSSRENDKAEPGNQRPRVIEVLDLSLPLIQFGLPWIDTVTIYHHHQQELRHRTSSRKEGERTSECSVLPRQTILYRASVGMS